MDNRRDWIGNLLTRPSQPGRNLWRHKNAIFSRPLFVFSSAKVIVREFCLLLCKSRCLHIKDICLLLTRSKSDVERFSWKHLAVAGTYTSDTFTITNAYQTRGSQESSRCFVIFFLVFFLAKLHRVSGTRQSDVREGTWLSQADISTFCFDVVYLLNTFSWNSRDRHPEAQMSSNSVNMHS